MSEQIRTMFARISPGYDKANAWLSLGLHHRWRRLAVRASGVRAGHRALDLATGTGDLALALVESVTVDGEVWASDFSLAMLRRARAKVMKAGVALQAADAQRLPYRDESFDVISIAFGIRNVDDPLATLREMKRVLRPSGSIVVVEFGRPTGIAGALFDLYARVWMPFLGGLLTGDRAAYRYLVRSSAAFPCGDAFAGLMNSAGLQVTEVKRLHGGVVFIYTATRS
ncbi:MAG: ubiquinone/menaquinone biosynthesis methyltransferase [Chlorobi bacterium]|nr:ubiquinone/menaquinone biosynthesis methyltransferase [Chlorobiota bacterium]